MILEKIGSAVIAATYGYALIALEKLKFHWKVRNFIVTIVLNFHF